MVLVHAWYQKNRIYIGDSDDDSFSGIKNWHCPWGSTVVDDRKNFDRRLGEFLKNLEDSWFGTWKLMLLGEWSDRKKLDLVHKKLVSSLKSKCKMEIDESFLKVIHDFKGGPLITQLCCKKGSCISKDGCLEEEKCMASCNDSNGGDNLSEWAYKLVSEAVNELRGLHSSVNIKPTILVLDYEVQGKAGCAPPAEELAVALKSHDLFMYFGHGSGTQYIPRREIQKLERCAATLLMGCSSGSLKLNGCYVLQGTPLSYLLAGSPVVVANLWDVTDTDIDRFAKSMLDSWLKARLSPCVG
ncbi:hypothetical protein ACLB2K_047190 [Fragaria x ananassa]